MIRMKEKKKHIHMDIEWLLCSLSRCAAMKIESIWFNSVSERTASMKVILLESSYRKKTKTNKNETMKQKKKPIVVHNGHN